MAIVINHWVVFEVYNDDELTEYFGRAVSGYVANSSSPRFKLEERVCTAGVVEVCMNEKVVRTKAGESFLLKGSGQFIQVSVAEFDVFSRTGFNRKLSENYLPIENVPSEIKDELNRLFENEEKLIIEWLTKPKLPLNGKSPIELLSTVGGIEQVRGMLERMRTGDFS